MEIKPELETFAKIKVIGVGGAGTSVIDRMIKSKIEGVEFISINTDAQALHHSDADLKLHIGKTVSRGLGAGMDPEIGRAAAEESKQDIAEAIAGADMVFITYGLGGGTGTGAGPVVADVARETGALTIGVVTKPFSFEGAQRAEVARVGLENIQDRVDTIITIPNDRLFQIIDKKTPLLDAFATVDQVLMQGVTGISNLITVPGIVNVDFADVKSVMQNAGSALMGIGRASGEDRAVEAAKMAIDSPLLEMSINGARGILFTITGGKDLGMYEIDEAAKVITESADPNARVIFGAVVDEKMQGDLQISVVATGFDQEKREPQKRGVDTSGINVTPGIRREEKKPLFSSKATSFMTGSRVVEEEPRRPEPEIVEPAPQMKIEEPEEVVPKTEEDSLDIPAFIRKKMK